MNRLAALCLLLSLTFAVGCPAEIPPDGVQKPPADPDVLKPVEGRKEQIAPPG